MPLSGILRRKTVGHMNTMAGNLLTPTNQNIIYLYIYLFIYICILYIIFLYILTAGSKAYDTDNFCGCQQSVIEKAESREAKQMLFFKKREEEEAAETSCFDSGT